MNIQNIGWGVTQNPGWGVQIVKLGAPDGAGVITMSKNMNNNRSNISRRTFSRWSLFGILGAAGALLFPKWGVSDLIQGDAEDDLRKNCLIVYRWGAWNRKTQGGNGVIGWIQCRFQDLKALDVALVYDSAYYPWSDEEFSFSGKLLYGMSVQEDPFLHDGVWGVQAKYHPAEVAKDWSDVDKICFCGDGKGNYQGCGGTQRTTWVEIPARLLRPTPPVVDDPYTMVFSDGFSV